MNSQKVAMFFSLFLIMDFAHAEFELQMNSRSGQIKGHAQSRAVEQVNESLSNLAKNNMYEESLNKRNGVVSQGYFDMDISYSLDARKPSKKFYYFDGISFTSDTNNPQRVGVVREWYALEKISRISSIQNSAQSVTSALNFLRDGKVLYYISLNVGRESWRMSFHANSVNFNTITIEAGKKMMSCLHGIQAGSIQKAEIRNIMGTLDSPVSVSCVGKSF